MLEALNPPRIESDKHSEIVSLGGCLGIIMIFIFIMWKLFVIRYLFIFFPVSPANPARHEMKFYWMDYNLL